MCAAVSHLSDFTKQSWLRFPTKTQATDSGTKTATTLGRSRQHNCTRSGRSRWPGSSATTWTTSTTSSPTSSSRMSRRPTCRDPAVARPFRKWTWTSGKKIRTENSSPAKTSRSLCTTTSWRSSTSSNPRPVEKRSFPVTFRNRSAGNSTTSFSKIISGNRSPLDLYILFQVLEINLFSIQLRNIVIRIQIASGSLCWEVRGWTEEDHKATELSVGEQNKILTSSGSANDTCCSLCRGLLLSGRCFAIYRAQISQNLKYCFSGPIQTQLKKAGHSSPLK